MAVISARSCSLRRVVESRKKSARTVDRRSRPAARGGASWSAAGTAIGHSSGNMQPALIGFPLTSRQLGSEMTHMLNDEERYAGVNQQRNQIGGPGTREGERRREEDRITPRQQ